jgi:S-DNA-T family DNA segregation ATPase FtsK/SpoIIIE
VRVTALSPAGAADVEVDDDLPVGRLRSALARLTGEPSWLSRPLNADGVGLDDDHPAGLAPLRHGATVRPGPGATPDAVRAARAPWHLAVVAGPGTGALLVTAGPTTLGPHGELPVADDEPWLVLLRPPRERHPWRPWPVRPQPSPVGVAGSGRPRRRPGVGPVRLRGTTSPAYLVAARGRTRRIAR